MSGRVQPSFFWLEISAISVVSGANCHRRLNGRAEVAFICARRGMLFLWPQPMDLDVLGWMADWPKLQLLPVHSFNFLSSLARFYFSLCVSLSRSLSKLANDRMEFWKWGRS